MNADVSIQLAVLEKHSGVVCMGDVKATEITNAQKLSFRHQFQVLLTFNLWLPLKTKTIIWVTHYLFPLVSQGHTKNLRKWAQPDVQKEHKIENREEFKGFEASNQEMTIFLRALNWLFICKFGSGNPIYTLMRVWSS